MKIMLWSQWNPYCSRFGPGPNTNGIQSDWGFARKDSCAKGALSKMESYKYRGMKQ